MSNYGVILVIVALVAPVAVVLSIYRRLRRVSKADSRDGSEEGMRGDHCASVAEGPMGSEGKGAGEGEEIKGREERKEGGSARETWKGARVIGDGDYIGPSHPGAIEA